MNTLTSAQISRRSVVAAGAAGAALLAIGAGAAAPAYATEAKASSLPATGADLTGSFVFWGPSTAVAGDFNQTPAGLRAHSVMSKLSELLITDKGEPYGTVPEYGFNNGGPTETSNQTLALRSTVHPYKPNFYYNGQNGMMPRTGQVILSTVDGRMPAAGNPFYTHIGGIHCTLEPAPNRPNKVLIKVQDNGFDAGKAPVKVGSGAASWARTGFEAYHRGHNHILWMGRDNVEQTDQVIADTRAAYDIEPATTVVLGQFATEADATARRQAIEVLNTKLATEYGDKFLDVHAVLRDSKLWAVQELAPYGIGTSAADKDSLSKGLPPRSLFSTDGRRLNSLGNQVLAHGIARFLTGAAGIYPADRYQAS